MLTRHQARSLRKLRALGSNWEPANLPRISQQTWDTLITLGFVEERRDGPSSQRSLRLTEKGRRAANTGAINKVGHKTAPARPRSQGCLEIEIGYALDFEDEGLVSRLLQFYDSASHRSALKKKPRRG